MGSEIVKFSNQFNNVALRKFDATHLDVLMAISSRVKERGTQTVTFSFAELRDLMRLGWKMSNRELAEKIVQTNKRLLALNYMFTDEEGGIVQFALFTEFRTLPSAATLTVAVNQRFAFLLNDLTSQFTRFELDEFTGLKSRYAKEFYRRAKQYRSTGLWDVGREDFCRLLDAPKSALTNTTYLNTKILKPIMDECGSLLRLRMERKYAKRRLIGFVFRFQAEQPPRPAAPARKAAARGGRPGGRMVPPTPPAASQPAESDIQSVIEALGVDQGNVVSVLTGRRRALTLLKAHKSVAKAVAAAKAEAGSSTASDVPLFD